MSTKLFLRTLAGFILIAFSISLPSVSFAQEGKWTTKADMPTPRWALSTSVVDGKIYAISGRIQFTGAWTAQVEEYDPATDTWTRKADIPTARSWFSTSVVNGKIYAIDGWSKTNASPVEEYDPATDTWTEKSYMSIQGRWELATSAVDGKIYVIGGLNRAAVEEYDPSTDTWVRKADMPTARGRLSASAVNGKIYAIGGYNWDSATNQETILSAVEEYDPATDTWTKKADMPMPTHEHTASVVNGKIYVMGGEGALTQTLGAAQTILSTIMKYDPVTDTWTKEGDMTVPRTGMSASVVYGRIYVIGGKEVGVRGIATVEAYQPEPYPADGAESVELNVELSWPAGLGRVSYAVYFSDNFDDVNNASGGLRQEETTYTPGPLEFAKTYYWRVDELSVGRGAEMHKGDIWSFQTVGGAEGPSPSNGAVDVKPTKILTWNTGYLAASHDVYFGTEAEAVKNATTASPEYKGQKALGEESYDPGILLLETQYYWRIDEFNSIHPDSPWKGPTWNFTTGNFFVVDDFEDYDSSENRIWFSWHDGIGYGMPGADPYFAGNGTGAAVGDETTGSYTEETIVHGGNQSMPVFYDNNQQGKIKYSETEMKLSYLRDWTVEGVGMLSLWFHGAESNGAEPMYVVINGNAVVTHSNLNAVQIETWTQWDIDLLKFVDQGVDMTDIHTFGLGFGDRNNPQPGGSGKMYFDDIRLRK